MKKSTDVYTLNIPQVKDDSNTKKGLQRACDAMNVYPCKISKSQNGVCLTILRNPSVASYTYHDLMMDLVAKIKAELTLTSVTMVKRSMTVDTDKLPAELKEFGKAAVVEAAEEDAKMLKQIGEDMDEFNTHTTKQFLPVDYNHKESIAAELRSIRILRANKRMPIKEESDEEIANKKGRNKPMQGQMVLDFAKM